jgi:PAS domain S-box-containing protein
MPSREPRRRATPLRRRGRAAKLRDLLSEYLYRQLVEISPSGVVCTSAAGLVEMANPQAVAMFGAADASQLIGLRGLDMLVEREAGAALLAEMQRSDQPRQGVFTFRRLDGGAFHANVHAAPLTSASGRYAGLLVTISDLTASEKAAAALRDSSANYRTIFNAVNDGIMVHDAATGRILDANRRMEELSGYRADELMATTPAAVAVDDERFSPQRALEYVRLAAQGTPQRFEWLGRRKDGSDFWSEVSLQRAQLGGASRVLAVVRDIGQRRAIDDRLRSSEANYRTIFESVSDGIIIHELPSCMPVDCNERMAAMYGYTRQEFLSKSTDDLSASPEFNKTAMIERFRRTIEGDAQVFDWHGRRKDGSTLWVEVSLRLATIGGNQRVLAVVRDVTDRQEALEALRKSENLLSSIIDQSPFSTWIADRNGTMVRLNRACRELFGSSSDEQAVGRYNIFLDPLVREQGFLPAVREVFASGVAARFTIDYDASRVPLVRGVPSRPRLLDTTIFPVKNPDGRVISAVVQNEDITARVQAERAMTRYAMRLEVLHDIESAIAAARSLPQIAEAAVARIRQLVPCNRVSVVEFDFAANVARLLAVSSSRPLSGLQTGSEMPLSEFGLSEDLLAGRTEVNSEKRSQGTHPVRQRLRDEGVTATVLTPLMHGGELIGSLNIGAATNEPFTAENIQVASEVAHMLAIALQRQRSEDTIARQRDFAERLINTAEVFIGVLSLDGCITRVNQFGQRILGLSEQQAIGRSCMDFIEPEYRAVAAAIIEACRGGQTVVNRELLIAAEGRQTLMMWNASPLQDSEGRITGILAIGRDITELRRKEQQLREAQRMEAIGLLAGGIAHDFNNNLAIIKGYCDVLLKELSPDHPCAGPVGQMQAAAARAAALTSQLLVFSRSQPLRPRVVDLAAMIEGMESSLVRLAGHGVNLRLELQRPAIALADEAQAQQSVINLVTNARDAMPRGGELVIRTRPVELDAQAPSHDGPPGRYVLLEVSDTGEGMDEPTRQRIFQPFFTTKAVGKGTGLGLPLVYSFVRQSGGWIEVHSQVGRGTTFCLHLPQPQSDADQDPATPAAMPGGSEAVLVVAETKALRNSLIRTLTDCGYNVTAVAGAVQAVEAARRQPPAVLVAPLELVGMAGQELAATIRNWQPRLKALYLAGDASPVPSLAGGEAIVYAPIGPAALASGVRQILDKEPS